VSSYYSICVLILLYICVLILLDMSPHPTLYMCADICVVLILDAAKMNEQVVLTYEAYADVC
jgi:hypothetical protein